MVSHAVVGSFLRRGTLQPRRSSRLELAQDDQRAHPLRRDERALDQPVLAQRVDRALLVAGELEVDVELDAVERRSREVREALLERRRAVDVLVVVRQQQPALVLEQTSNSIMSTPCASAASNDAGVLPGTIRSAPLCPIRLSADIVDTSMSSGCRRPARAPGCGGLAAARARARRRCRRRP